MRELYNVLHVYMNMTIYSTCSIIQQIFSQILLGNYLSIHIVIKSLNFYGTKRPLMTSCLLVDIDHMMRDAMKSFHVGLSWKV